MGRFSASKMAISIFLLKMAAITVRVHAQSSQADFISIDCGIAINSSYVDQETNILYVSDEEYIDTGSISAINPNYENSSPATQFLNLRSFPTGVRNCYTLPVVQNERYLVRARFMYGDYDGENKANSANPLQFELHLGVDLWHKINITDASSIYNFEALTLTAANFTSVCLINTGNGDPFISVLELRPLKNSMYNISQSDVKLFTRVNFGPLSDETLRYPDDPYDRFWHPLENAATWTTISTNSTVDSKGDDFEAPSAVIQTAIVPTKGTTLVFEFDSDSLEDEFYHILYFTELQRLSPNSTRFFDIYMNDYEEWSNFTPPYLSSDYVYRVEPFSGDTRYTYSLNATTESTLPPIINALELYSIIRVTGVPTDLDDVYAIDAIRKQYIVKKNWMGDPCSPGKYIWDGLECRNDSHSSRITSLNLSSSGLTGVISSSFTGLTELTYLDLSNNNLTGAIPDALGNMPSLKTLILSCNNLTGPIPASLRQRSSDGQVVVRYDNTANACEKFLESSSKRKISKPIIVVVSVVPAVVVLLVAFIIWRIRKVRALGSNPSMPPQYYHMSPPRAENLDHVDHQIQAQMKRFTYNELAYLTRNFESVIGGGGFGVVYLGTLHDGKQVAVKMRSHVSTQGEKEFLAEAQNLTRIHHRNLVSLVGYCKDENYMGLVYEYMAQGSLRDHLKENTGYRSLNWVERLRIAVESAQGLEYLHKGCSPPIIHRDVKTSNILLNKDMKAKLADFGMSKVFQNDNQSHVSTQNVVGTPGYLDPEYQSSRLLNEKSDVYSFGVVLMELITGQSPIIRGPQNQDVHIAKLVAQSIERGYKDDIVDKRLHGEYDKNSVWKIVVLSMKCMKPKGRQRPSMSEVVMRLNETLDLALGTTTTEESQNSSSLVYITPSESP